MSHPFTVPVRRRLAAAACSLAVATGLAGVAVTAPLSGAAHAASSPSVADTVARIDSLLAGAAAPTTGVDELGESQFADVRNAAIDPTQYQCAPTALLTWASAQRGSAEVMAALNRYALLDLPTYQAIVFETDATPQRIGLDGEYTSLIDREMKDLRGFWDIRSDDIQLVGMHTDIYKDPDLLAPLVEWGFGVDAQTAAAVAPLFIDLVNLMPRGADNPLFTFNAFAFSAAEQPAGSPLAGLPDKIAYGDGIIEGLAAVGLDRTALQSVLAHEFGHHVQYEDGLFDNTTLTGPEATRRTELMADAFDAYYLVHARGEAINKKRVVTTTRQAAEVGDCGFTSEGHHGTPLQRERTVSWAADLANAALPQGTILPSRTFAAKFDEQLPVLVAPDAV